MPIRTLTTSVADVAVWDSNGRGPAVLMLHGNSSCKEIYAPQFESPLAERFRLIAIDLPGHGASGDARDPASGYILAGYVTAALEVARQLDLTRAVVFGWSLGGHIALDMMLRLPGLAGVMICGTPPVPATAEGAILGFQQTASMALSSAAAWSDADAETYARVIIGPNARLEPFMLAAARRTHAVAREIFFAHAVSGAADDQRQIAETAATPLAIVNGAEDPFLNAAYFDTVRYANLWDGEVHRLDGVGHAPFWEAPERFNPLLERFAMEASDWSGG